MPAYLLLGSEHGKKKEFIEKTAAAFIKKSGRSFQTYRFYLDSDDTEAFFGALSNPSLFGDLQILIVSNAERLKGKPAKEAAALFKNLSDLTLLFFCSDETSAAKLDKTAVSVFDKEHTVVFWELFESDKQSWVFSFFLERKIKITPEAVSELLDTVTNDTEELRAVCSRLADFKGSGEITASDWENYLYHSKEENVFTLFEKIVNGRFESAVEAVRKILYSGESNLISMAAGLAWQFRRLMRIHVFISSGSGSREDAFDAENIRGKRNRKLYEQALSVFDAETTQNVLLLLNRTDALLKQGAFFSNEVVADLLVYRLTVEKGAATDLFPSSAVLD